MLISKIFNKLNKNQKEGFVLGLAWGLAWGLAGGLAGGLAWGLVWGLVVILTNFREAFPFINNFIQILIIILGILIIVEIMFWITKEDKPKKNIFLYVCKKKLENVFEVLLVISLISQIYILTRDINFLEYFPKIINVISIIIVILICLGMIIELLYLWIKLNSLKYKIKEKENEK